MEDNAQREDEQREDTPENKATETRQADPAKGRRADVRLRAVSGVVIDYSLPLHESVMDQWRKGELSRVDDDDMPWSDGDEYDLSSAYEDRDGSVPDDMRRDRGDADADSDDDGEEDDEPVATLPDQDHANVADVPGPPAAHEPGRPDTNAPKKAWQQYAVTVNAVSEDEAAGMTRQQLIDRATPPELKPGV